MTAVASAVEPHMEVEEDDDRIGFDDPDEVDVDLDDLDLDEVEEDDDLDDED